jgi:hypothetical protein
VRIAPQREHVRQRLHLDGDGRVRIAIGSSTPNEAPNRIDTLGRSQSALICRIIGASGAAMPEAAIHAADQATG